MRRRTASSRARLGFKATRLGERSRATDLRGVASDGLHHYIRGVQPHYELFDHTADMGIRVRAATLPGLVQPAVDALYSVIGTFALGANCRPLSLTLTDGTPAELLRDLLAELLVLFECERRVITAVNVSRFDEECLVVAAATTDVDEDSSVYLREVKAITYHALDIRAIAGGYEATIIVDI